METVVYANYKPTDTLSASGFIWQVCCLIMAWYVRNYRLDFSRHKK